MHGRDTGRWQRIGDITDPQLDHFPLRMVGLEGGHPFGDIEKKIGSLQLQIVFVYFQHEKNPFN